MVALTGRVAILAARDGGEAIKANKIAASAGPVPKICPQDSCRRQLETLCVSESPCLCVKNLGFCVVCVSNFSYFLDFFCQK